MFINVITLYVRSANSLSLMALIVVCFTISPSFFSYVESPKWLYKKGLLTRLINSLEFISKRNNSGLTSKDLYDPLFEGKNEYEAIKDKQIEVQVLRKDGKTSNSFHDIKELFTTPTYINIF